MDVENCPCLCQLKMHYEGSKSCWYPICIFLSSTDCFATVFLQRQTVLTGRICHPLLLGGLSNFWSCMSGFLKAEVITENRRILTKHYLCTVLRFCLWQRFACGKVFLTYGMLLRGNSFKVCSVVE